MGENLNDEIFFFMYHMNISETQCLDMHPERRKWMIHRFVEQKKKENEEIEKAKRSSKAKGGKR